MVQLKQQIRVGGSVVEDIMTRFAGIHPAWHEHAACRGLAYRDDIEDDLFYPSRGQTNAVAKAICAGCPVREECLQDALEMKDQFGVWGGLGEKERRPLHRGQRTRRPRLEVAS